MLPDTEAAKTGQQPVRAAMWSNSTRPHSRIPTGFFERNRAVPTPPAMIHTRPNPCSSVFIRGFFYLLLCTPLALLAQPIPKLTAISPEWIQRGTTVEIVFTGENLGAVTGFIFSGDAGLSATNVPLPAPPQPAITIESVGGAITSAAPPPARDEKRLVAKVTATADAAFSAREVRVVSPGGVSNPLQLNAGQWPEVREKEPDNSIEQAQLITFPGAISGVISAASQVD